MSTRPVGRPKLEGPRPKALAVGLYPEEIETIRAFAKDGGYPSLSSAARHMIVEWIQFRKSEQQPYTSDVSRPFGYKSTTD